MTPTEEMIPKMESKSAPTYGNPENLEYGSKAPFKFFLMLAFLELLWAPVNYFVVLAQQGGMSPAAIGLVRWIGVCGGLFLLLLFPAFRRKSKAIMPNRRQVVQSIAIGLLLTGPSHLMYYASLGHTETVEGTVFNATAPLWIALFAGWVLSEKVGLTRWLALILGGIGAYFASVGFQLPNIHQGHLGWDGLYLLGTMLECFGGALLARIIRQSSGIGAFAWETSGRALAMIIYPLLFPSVLPMVVHFSPASTLAMAYLVVIAGLITFGCWVVIIEKAPLSLMVVTIALQTPLAAVLGHYFLGEKLSPGLFFGATLIFIGLFLASRNSGDISPDENLSPAEVAAH